FARVAHRAAALAGQEELTPPPREVLPDRFLRRAVVRRRVDEVDAGVEHGVQELAGGARVEVAAHHGARSSQRHCPVTQLGDGEAGTAQGASWEISHAVTIGSARRTTRGPLMAYENLKYERRDHEAVATLE